MYIVYVFLGKCLRLLEEFWHWHTLLPVIMFFKPSSTLKDAKCGECTLTCLPALFIEKKATKNFDIISYYHLYTTTFKMFTVDQWTTKQYGFFTLPLSLCNYDLNKYKENKNSLVFLSTVCRFDQSIVYFLILVIVILFYTYFYFSLDMDFVQITFLKRSK